MTEKHTTYVLDISDRAEVELERILQDTLDARGERQMLAYAKEIKHVFERLLDHPMSGHVRHDIPEGYRAIAVGKHMVVYRIEGHTVYVVAILYGRMDFKQWFDS